MGAQVRRIVVAGELVSDDLVEKVVHRRLSEHDWNFGFIIDGFPRNQPQARFFLESYDLDAVILLEVPDELVEERILSRRLCSRCGVDYILISPGRPWPGPTMCAAGGWWPGPTTLLRRSRAASGTSTRRPGPSWSVPRQGGHRGGGRDRPGGPDPGSHL